MALPADGDTTLAQPPPPEPITIAQAITDLQAILVQIRRKLRTLTDWYIYPEITPNEIQAYDPRLVILHQRLQSMSTLSYTQLACLIDNSDTLASQYLTGIVGQLLNAAHGIQSIFTNHYDRDLEERRPFQTIWELLTYRDDQLKLIPNFNPSNPRHLRPEDLRGPNNELGSFCRGALQISNGRDKGRISIVEKKDLVEDERRQLRDFAGAFLAWECPECAYTVRYHVSSSVMSNIRTTAEIREHAGVDLQYRASFLAASHLFMPLGERIVSTSASSNDRRRLSRSRSRVGDVMKYGCVFCFAQGHQLEPGYSVFATARTLAEHIAQEHSDPFPPAMMLHRFLVAIKGKSLDDRTRWELNFV